MITNNNDVSLALAVWLVHDSYDYQNKPNYLSATSLLKPLRQAVLGARVAGPGRSQDVVDFAARAMGTAMHDSIERAWKENYRRSMAQLGYKESVIDRIRINPTDEEVKADPNIIPIYIEQRHYREFHGFIIGGKFDMVMDGRVEDTKSTGVIAWTTGDKDEGYRTQASIYRWIDAAQPMQKIHEDYMRVNFIFTDWQAFKALTDPNYPQHKVRHRDLPLLSLQDTEALIRSKLNLFLKYKDAPESTIPECTDEELWRADPKFKYYADPNKTAKSTKNFDTLAEANAWRDAKGVGIVKTVMGVPKRCNYCPAFAICTQKDRYFTK